MTKLPSDNTKSFTQFCADFQELVNQWKEYSTDENWLRTHKDELNKLGLDVEQLQGDIRKSINQILDKILNGSMEE